MSLNKFMPNKTRKKIVKRVKMKKTLIRFMSFNRYRYLKKNSKMRILTQNTNFSNILRISKSHA
jgi:hypothetical protein